MPLERRIHRASATGSSAIVPCPAGLIHSGSPAGCPPGEESVAGPAGCRYVFFEKRAEDQPRTLDLDTEKDYERKLTLRLDTSLADFLKENT